MSNKAEVLPLTGLRGVAALMVVANHYSVWCAPFGANRPWWSTEIFGTGAMGMTLFFALSGFVITYNYFDLDWRNAPLRSARTFALLRFSRLYPALIIFLLIQSRYPDDPAWMAMHFFSLETWLPAKLNGVLPINGMFSVAWSISTEIGLYTFFVFAMLVRSSLGNRLVLFFVALCLGLAFFVSSPPTWPLVLTSGPFEPVSEIEWMRWFRELSPYGRATEFAIGSCSAIVILRYSDILDRHRPALYAVSIAGVSISTALFFSHFWPELLSDHILQISSALALSTIFLNAQHDNAINRALSRPLMLLIGTVSYSLYLFHFVVPNYLLPWRWWSGVEFSPSSFAILIAVIVACMVTSIILAWIIFKLVERPSQKILREFQFEKTLESFTALK